MLVLMGKTVRSILALIAGFIAASAVMMLFEIVNGRVLYPELGKMAEGMTDREAIRALLATAPVGAFLVVLLGWVAGSFGGGFLAARIGSHREAVTRELNKAPRESVLSAPNRSTRA